MPQRKMDHGDVDPADELREKIGYIDDIDVYFSKVLCAIYLRPTKLKKIQRDDGSVGQLHLPDKVVEEDLYQGKAALVLKVGPGAFRDAGAAQFYGQKVDVGDWVVFRPSAGLKMTINGTDCILLQDVQVELRIPAPDIVY